MPLQQRFRLFNLAALEALRALPFGPGEDCLIVCNDWHTALLPVLLKDVYQPRGEFTKTKVALTLHNIAYQVSPPLIAYQVLPPLIAYQVLPPLIAYQVFSSCAEGCQ